MIYICSPQLRIAPEAVLGGEVYDREVLTALAQLDTSVHILLPAGQPYPHDPQWQITHLPLKRGYRWFVSNPLFVPYIGRAYKQQPFNILRVHSTRFTGLAALWAKQLYRLPIPIVAHHHHIDQDRWLKQIDKRVMTKADIIITVSQFAKQELIEVLDIPAEKIVVAYNGVNFTYKPDLQRSTIIRRQLNLDHKEIILHIGSLIARKNLFFLLQTFKEVLRHRPNTHLILVGRGPQADALQEQANTLGIQDALTLTGSVTDQEKLDYILASNLYLSTSLNEGFGLAVAEAMACGLPVVALDRGALSEVIVDQETGILVSEQDQMRMSQAILDLLQDPMLASQMGQVGAKRIETHFRWTWTAKTVHQYYQSLLI